MTRVTITNEEGVMPKFEVCATNIEYLLTTEIEAENVDDARDKYIAMWNDGEILVNKSEIVNIRVESA